MISIRDTIDEKLRDFMEYNEDEPVKLKIDTYTYAMLLEELGLSPEDIFTEYRGLILKVDPDIEDICEIL